MRFHTCLLALVLICWGSSGASATTIVSATSATASSSFSSTFGIGNTIDQSGLSVGYTSGVTDFDTYIGSNISHDFSPSGIDEWFSATDITSVTIIYDLGLVLNIDRIALWNEDLSGFGTGSIATSTDNVIFTALTTINPVISGFGVDYFAQIFGFASTTAQFIRIDISGCPQVDNGFNGCGIGEVAFSSVSAVPLPAALPLFGTGLAVMGLIGWRRKRKAAAA